MSKKNNSETKKNSVIQKIIAPSVILGFNAIGVFISTPIENFKNILQTYPKINKYQAFGKLKDKGFLFNFKKYCVTSLGSTFGPVMTINYLNQKFKDDEIKRKYISPVIAAIVETCTTSNIEMHARKSIFNSNMKIPKLLNKIEFSCFLKRNILFWYMINATNEWVGKKDFSKTETFTYSLGMGGMIAAITNFADQMASSACVNNKYNSYTSFAYNMIKENGLKTFTRGMMPRVIRVGPDVAIFTIGMQFANYILKQKEEKDNNDKSL
jgi:hypothetical protein